MKKEQKQVQAQVKLGVPSVESIAHGRSVSYGDDGSFLYAESFEGSSVPEQWRAEGGGFLSLSAAHYKHGSRSLKWQWEQGSKLVADRPNHLDNACQSRNGGIKFWIYNERALSGNLTFRFGSERGFSLGQAPCSFEIGVGFTGWRGFNIHFREDGGYDPTAGLNEYEPLMMMEMIPPAEEESGTIFIDVIEFVESVPASRSSDWQLPFLRQKANGGKGGSWDRSFYFSRLRPGLPEEPEITSEQKNAFATITKRYERWILGHDIDLSLEPLRIRYESLQSFIREGVECYDALGIRRDENGNVTGVPLFSSRSSHGPEFGKDVARTIFLPIVLDYKLNGNDESKFKALDLFDHFHDQGWAAGSGLETLDHETNRNNGYFHSVFLMREELRKTGRLQREQAAMHWFINFGKTYGFPDKDYTETTADEVRTRFVYKLLVVLAMDDSPEKVRHMRGLLLWMNHALAIAPGFAGTIKHDYMGFHHRGVYMSAYAPNALETAALMTYLLHGTPFALEAESVENVKRALLTLRIVTNKYDVPTGISGRYPSKGPSTHELLSAYAYLAFSGEQVDRELAGAFMRLWNPEEPFLKQFFAKADSKGVEYMDTLGGLQLTVKLSLAGFEPENSPEGFWIKPSSALAVLRRDNWMLSTKGWSQYVFDFEAHGMRPSVSTHKSQLGENVYGRYISYGAIQIFAGDSTPSAESSGYSLDRGWDWCRWPGTTAKHVVLEELETGRPSRGARSFTDKTRSFTDETFVGGVTSEGMDGVFSMKLHDTVFDPSFRAIKSVFYFGGDVIVIGSGICCDDVENRVTTTLFQSFLGSSSVPFLLEGTEVTQLPWRHNGANGQSTWMLDPYGNGYVVKEAGGLIIERNVQHSRDHRGVKETEGCYTTAWIDHGIRPQDADYEYAILVQTTPDEVNRYAVSPRHRVLQKDASAHVVSHHEKQSIGYAIFDESSTMTFGVFRKSSTPVIVMEKRRDSRLLLSLADPDLRLPKLKNQQMDEKTVWTAGTKTIVQVELEGRWICRSNPLPHAVIAVTSDDDKTLLDIQCVNGHTIEIELEEI
ncbi:chondroitinase family polysaccharide lyase [Paenibacillus sp. UNC451MF]|uniref:chondroitinase family polysaccharide lyase n=1 Tax=Paenibacillus sp. UNC451MF TaxID=1449063 RepID=UPI00068F55A0|nr:chondroitinase family polysaccharide lyase [Paenibacillus sp. UNC451MF]